VAGGGGGGGLVLEFSSACSLVLLQIVIRQSQLDFLVWLMMHSKKVGRREEGIIKWKKQVSPDGHEMLQAPYM
jgi:hypothetical protein